jgi:hypothetical protein
LPTKSGKSRGSQSALANFRGIRGSVATKSGKS